MGRGEVTTWRELIAEEMADHKETWGDILIVQFLWGDADTEFHSGFGTSEGSPFTLWTKKRAYFPVVYDGCEWVASVSRDPDSEATHHVGGQ